MKRILALSLALFMAFALVACDKEQSQTEAPASQETGTVEVAADGTVFDPPISPDRLPDGVYYCDMGTTHYARAHYNGERCPECNMMLTLKGEAPKEDAPEEAEEAVGAEEEENTEEEQG